MARSNLRRDVRALEIGSSLRVKLSEYREQTVRNYAAQVGKAEGRTYTARRDGEVFYITRLA